MNKKGTKATFGTNKFSDMDDDEKLEWLGIDPDSPELDNLQTLTNNYAGQLSNTDYEINWADLGKVHSVKDQGNCGSCSYFAAAVALESYIAIRDDTSVVRLSEQQGVDCTTNTQENIDMFGRHYGALGCSGGWVDRYWRFSRDNGSMINDDYPYEAVDGACRHDGSKTVANVATWGYLSGDVLDAKIKLQD